PAAATAVPARPDPPARGHSRSSRRRLRRTAALLPAALAAPAAACAAIAAAPWWSAGPGRRHRAARRCRPRSPGSAKARPCTGRSAPGSLPAGRCRAGAPTAGRAAVPGNRCRQGKMAEAERRSRTRAPWVSTHWNSYTRGKPAYSAYIIIYQGVTPEEQMVEQVKPATIYYSRPWKDEYGTGVSSEMFHLPHKNMREMVQHACGEYAGKTTSTICLDNGMSASLKYP